MFLLRVILLLSLLPFSAWADFLVIGDSHTAGPFGKYLHNELSARHPEQVVITLGHSSSAPIHWWEPKVYSLVGGVEHRLNWGEIKLTHPAPVHWKVPVATPKFLTVFETPVLHPSWQKKMSERPVKITTVVFALGGNDRNAVSTDSGERTKEFERRVKILDAVLKEVKVRGWKCQWVGPPSSIKRSDAKEQTTQEYLELAIQNRCPMFDSRKFVAKDCDFVHFNCAAALPTAKLWASEVADFIDSNL